MDKDTQQAIVEEVKLLTYSKNPKVWLGIKWLSTYIAIRPNEMLQLSEKDVDYKTGYFIVRHTKEGRVKPVPMLQEDIDIIKRLPLGMPHLPFFRHSSGFSGILLDFLALRLVRSLGLNTFIRYGRKHAEILE